MYRSDNQIQGKSKLDPKELNHINPHEKLEKEIESFQGIWKGGYCEGNPLDPIGRSSYGRLGYLSVLYAIYIACIRPYITNQTKVIEIGPGRGCWTKCFVEAEEIWCLDALPADYNNFWEYVGKRGNIKYIQVHDFSCSTLPDDYFDFFFTFGCFCHISKEGIDEYMKNLYPKLKTGAHGFVMIGDYEKYNKLVEKKGFFDIGNYVFSDQRLIDNMIFRKLWRVVQIIRPIELKKIRDIDNLPHPGRWYDYRTEDFCEMLKLVGYGVLDKDCGVTHRDPVVHFIKR